MTDTSTATHIIALAARYQVNYTEGPNDRIAYHLSRLSDDAIELDQIELLLIGL